MSSPKGPPPPEYEYATEYEISTIAQIRKALEGRAAWRPDHDHIDDFDRVLGNAMVFAYARGTIDTKLLPTKQSPLEWLAFLKQERLNCWTDFETRLSILIREEYKGSKPELETKFKALVVEHWEIFNLWARDINEYAPKEDSEIYLAAITKHYQAKAEAMLRGIFSMLA